MKQESHVKMSGHLIDTAGSTTARSTQCHMPRGYADSLLSTVSTHTHCENIMETNIQRIIGRRCRCAGRRAPRPEKRMWCVWNGKWRWVIPTLLAVMIFLFGKAIQPRDRKGKNVIVQTNARMAFDLCLHALTRVVWFLSWITAQTPNFTMWIISARHSVHFFPYRVVRVCLPSLQSAPSSSCIETCSHESAHEHGVYVNSHRRRHAYSSK